MRIGEIAVVGPHAPAKRKFVRNVCDEIAAQTDDFIFGRLKVAEQLLLHLYGVSEFHCDPNLSWQLVSNKLLGYILLFDWQRSESLGNIKNILDELTAKQTPVIVVANIEEGSPSRIPAVFLKKGLGLTSSCQLTFCDVGNRKCAKAPLVLLLDTIIEKME